jgi:hypothetical protein
MIRRFAASDVSREVSVMAQADDEINDRAREICVDQKAHEC